MPAPGGIVAESVNAADFDAVIVPDGYAPDRMLLNPAMVKLVRDSFTQRKENLKAEPSAA